MKRFLLIIIMFFAFQNLSYSQKTLWGWGRNQEYQLPDSIDCFPHAPIDGNYIKISSFTSTTLAIKPDGTLWAWG